jgi:hypothetical protein
MSAETTCGELEMVVPMETSGYAGITVHRKQGYTTPGHCNRRRNLIIDHEIWREDVAGYFTD